MVIVIESERNRIGMKLKGTIGSLKSKQEEVTSDVTSICKEFEDFILKTRCASLCISQVGIHKRIVGVKTRDRKRVTIMVNPVITKTSKWMQKKHRESCISAKGSIFADVSRPMAITVQYMSPDLSKVKKKHFYRRGAAAACHVIEMCDGKLIK